MNRSVRRRLERALQQSAPVPEVDMTGWDWQRILIHKIEKYGLAALVKEADQLARQAPSEPEADATPPSQVGEQQVLEEAKPPAVEEPPPPESPPEPPPWYEELCRWRKRTPEEEAEYQSAPRSYKLFDD